MSPPSPHTESPPSPHTGREQSCRERLGGRTAARVGYSAARRCACCALDVLLLLLLLQSAPCPPVRGVGQHGPLVPGGRGTAGRHERTRNTGPDPALWRLAVAQFVCGLAATGAAGAGGGCEGACKSKWEEQQRRQKARGYNGPDGPGARAGGAQGCSQSPETVGAGVTAEALATLADTAAGT